MLALTSSSPPPPSSSISKPGSSGASTVSFNSETSKYNIKFDEKTVETTVTDKAAIVDQWIQDINVLYPPNSSAVVGLCVEQNSLNYWSSGSRKFATLNLCIDDKCLILQLIWIDNLPLSLKNFLKNPNFFFVGFDVDSDIASIKNNYGLDCGVRADILRTAMEKWRNRFNCWSDLKYLAKELLGLSMKKPRLVNMSNWENRVFTIEQVEYGSIHAYVSYKIGNLLLRDD